MVPAAWWTSQATSFSNGSASNVRSASISKPQRSSKELGTHCALSCGLRTSCSKSHSAWHPWFLACLLKQGGRRLSHKDALDITHRIQIALIEPHPRFANHPVQIDDSLMGYSNLVRTNVIGGVDTSTRRAWVEPIYGPGEPGQFIPLHRRPR